jgi:hypothetical protein
MSIRARREQLKKVGFKDKKLSRLLYCRDLTRDDEYTINYLNEERQSLNFFYGIGSAGLGTLGFNFAFFRMYSAAFQFCFMVGAGLSAHFLVRRSINQRFDSRIESFFQKYEVK